MNKLNNSQVLIQHEQNIRYINSENDTIYLKPNYEKVIANKKSIFDNYELDYHNYYYLCYAGIGQIIKAISEVKITKTKNIFEKNLSKFFKHAIPILIEEFAKCSICKNENDYQVKKYNLMNSKLPRNISIKTEDHHVKLKHAKLGKLIDAAKQRLEFIIERPIPDYYNENVECKKCFVLMKDDLKKFLQELEMFENEFIEVINKSHIIQKNNKMKNKIHTINTTD